MTKPRPAEAASGIHYQAGGMVNQLALRNYDGESLADLEPVRELVDALVDRHKTLVPGDLCPLLETWRDELASAIETKNADPHP